MKRKHSVSTVETRGPVKTKTRIFAVTNLYERQPRCFSRGKSSRRDFCLQKIKNQKTKRPKFQIKGKFFCLNISLSGGSTNAP